MDIPIHHNRPSISPNNNLPKKAEKMKLDVVDVTVTVAEEEEYLKALAKKVHIMALHTNTRLPQTIRSIMDTCFMSDDEDDQPGPPEYIGPLALPADAESEGELDDGELEMPSRENEMSSASESCLSRHRTEQDSLEEMSIWVQFQVGRKTLETEPRYRLPW